MDTALHPPAGTRQRFNPLDYSLCLSEPRYLSGTSAWQEHIPFAFACIEMLRPGVFVELGAHKGDSYCAFCQAVDMLRLATKCYAVDTWKGDEHAGFYYDSVFRELKAYHDPLYGSFSRLIRSTFDQALDHFPDGSVDLLHIDGLHTYEAVRHDFEAWLPKLSARGVVLFHDTNVRERGFGVGKLWAELSRTYPTFEFVHGHGLGVLAAGSEAPEALLSLTSADDDTTQSVRSFFFEIARSRRSGREIERLRQRLKTYGDEIELLRTELAARSSEAEKRADEIKRVRIELEARSSQVAKLEEEAKTIKRSIVWKTVKPIWKLGRRIQRLEQAPFRDTTARRRFVIPRSLGVGRKLVFHRNSLRLEPFVAWQMLNAKNARRDRILDAALVSLTHKPRFSVVIPVFDPPEEALNECIESVLVQRYPNWQLILVDDKSTNPCIRHKLAYWEEYDRRVRAIYRDENGHISASTNMACEAATGDFLVFLDNDDRLHPDALAHFAIYINAHSDTDIIYSDDAKISAAGDATHSPKFKPDWSPELLLSYCYISHLVGMRRSLYNAVGQCRLGFEGSQDHDLLLRATERARHIGHVPQVLYERRVLPGSTAATGNAKPYAFEAGRRAVEEAFHRRGVSCRVDRPAWAQKAGLGIFVPEMPDDGPSVAIIIPTKNNYHLLARLLASMSCTTYRNYVVYVVDNMSDDLKTTAYLAELPHRVMTIANPADGFNFAHVNNVAASAVNEDLLLFLNNDIEVLEPRWLSQMVGWSRLSGVGAVGARLLYPNGRVQHGGILQGLHGGLAGTAFKGLSATNSGYLCLARASRNCSAVTAACMLTPRPLFLRLGGFDSERFAVAYNDVDYGHRVRDAGYRVVYCGEAELIHHEGASRGYNDDPREVAHLRELHGGRQDPYYSKHLSLQSSGFEIQPTVVPDVEEASALKALMVSHNLNWEGAPQSQFELAIGLKQTGVLDPIVWSPRTGPLAEKYEEAGIEVIIGASPASKVQVLNDYLRQLREFEKYIVDSGFQLVYGNTAQAFWAIDGAYRAGVPSVWTIRESEPWRTYFTFLPDTIADRALSCFRLPYRIVFVAKSTARQWAELDEMRNFTVVHNGLDAERFRQRLAASPRDIARGALGILPDEIFVLLLGTVCERKGQHDLVKAFSKLPEGIAERMRCIIVGVRNDQYSRSLRRLLDKLPPDRRGRVSVIPETGDTGRFWSAADVFCCTSRVESFPRVILEAMASGLPIVTTPVYGISEQVREGRNALFYQPGDTSGLADRLARLARDGDYRRRLAEASPWVLRGLVGYREMLQRYAEIFKAAAVSSIPSIP